jgi:carbon monoxide dehydrogenase subunit G
MITIEDQFVIAKPLPEVWAFFDNFEGLATCVPTLKEFKLTDPDHIEGKVGVTLGAIPVTSKVRIEVTEKRAPECIQAHGLSYLGETIATQLAKGGEVGKYKTDDMGQLYLHLDLRAEDAGSTRVMLCAGVEAEGKLRKMYESIMRLKVPAMKKEFQEKVAAALKTQCSPVPEAKGMCSAIDDVKAHIEAHVHAHDHRAESAAPSAAAAAAAELGLWARIAAWFRGLFAAKEVAS